MSSPSRRTVLRLLPLFPLAGLFAAAEAHATHYEARLCNSCGFGSKKDNCVRCGKWVGSFRQLAYLCGSCGFGSKKDNCAICGKWAP